MKKIALVIVLATLTMFATGQTNEEVKQFLSNPETRMLIMDQISGDVILSKEMMSRIRDVSKSDTAMRHSMMSGMMEACKADTAMRHCMMSGMMNACKADSGMMKSMHKHMMENPQMRESMERMMKEKHNSKIVEDVDKSKLSVIKKDR